MEIALSCCSRRMRSRSFSNWVVSRADRHRGILALAGRRRRKAGSSLISRMMAGGYPCPAFGDGLAELGEKLVDLGLLGVVETVGLAFLEEAKRILLQLRGEVEGFGKVIEVDELGKDLLARHGREVGLVPRVVDAGARVEEADDPLVVVPAQVDEALDFG